MTKTSADIAFNPDARVSRRVGLRDRRMSHPSRHRTTGKAVGE
ncbi:hypothetical protein [Agrobacterium vitis]|nr:hypothetical protein [Agrobacterium vitis]